MQFVEGQTLKTFPRKDRRELARMARDATRAAAEGFGDVIPRDPQNAPGWRSRGGVRANRGYQQSLRGGDPWALYEDGLRDLDRAIELDPCNATSRWWRGNARFNRGLWRQHHGGGARAECEAAIADHREAARRDASLEAQMRARIQDCERRPGGKR